jgi:hypothetical protein
MGIAVKNVRNWGKEQQFIALSLLLEQKRLAFKVYKGRLFISGSYKGLTLPFVESIADLHNPRRGFWESTHPIDGSRLSTGGSLLDVVRSTIQIVCA